MVTEKRNPMITVIIPVYKAEPYIRKCLESIINQTYTNLEILVVDDGSPDACPMICDEYQKKDRRVKVIHKTNGGVSSARNVALEIASGEYIAFVDADDWIDINYFSELVQYEADVIVSTNTTTSGLFHVSEIKANYYSWGGFVGPCEKLYKRNKIKNIVFREDIPVGEDILFNLEVLKKIETIYYCKYKGYHITNNPESLTRSKRNAYDYQLDEEWQKKWGEAHRLALLEAGIEQELTTEVNKNGCSVWIYQKIKNYCYSDCPHNYKEKILRIQRQLMRNRDVILQVRTPTSLNTFRLIKLCVLLKNPHITYFIFRILVLLKV